jgi:hypothetical protein
MSHILIGIVVVALALFVLCGWIFDVVRDRRDNRGAQMRAAKRERNRDRTLD